MKKEKKDKTYGARGEKSLEGIFKDAIGVGVNQAIKYMMDDVKNMEYGNVYDTHILVNNIALRELTYELEKIQNRREELEEELTLLDESEKELKDAVDKIKKETLEHQEHKKNDRNLKLNDICNKILIEYDKNKGSFNSMDIMRIIDESEVEESYNIVVGYIQNSLKSLDTENTICLHESMLDDGYRIKVEKKDVDVLLSMLDDLRY